MWLGDPFSLRAPFSLRVQRSPQGKMRSPRSCCELLRLHATPPYPPHNPLATPMFGALNGLGKAMVGKKQFRKMPNAITVDHRTQDDTGRKTTTCFLLLVCSCWNAARSLLYAKGSQFGAMTMTHMGAYGRFGSRATFLRQESRAYQERTLGSILSISGRLDPRRSIAPKLPPLPSLAGLRGG